MIIFSLTVAKVKILIFWGGGAGVKKHLELGETKTSVGKLNKSSNLIFRAKPSYIFITLLLL